MKNEDPTWKDRIIIGIMALAVVIEYIITALMMVRR